MNSKLISSLQNDKNVIIATVIFIIVSCFILYSPSFNGSFVYDDSFYITDNNFTKDFSWVGISKIWSNYIFGNYNPITITSLALDYELFGVNTIGYHIINILLHILTCIVLLFFIRELTGNQFVAIISSIVFAIHPLHVESVSWISGRKDLLFTLFFIISLFYYLKYLKEKTKSNYSIVFLFFVLSCLSKAIAVVLPIILLLLDYFNNRKFKKQCLLEKVPFFIISLILGLIAIDAQSQEGALRIQEQYGFFDKILLSFHSIYFYIEKFILPNNLSANYPFPKKIDGFFPVFIYISSTVAFIGLILTYISKKMTNKILFCILLFLITIFPVLQIVAVGNAVTADRFAYLPIFGLILLITWGIHFLLFDKKSVKIYSIGKLIVPIFMLWIFFLCFTTYNRAKVWENEFTLFSDMIEKNPDVAFYYNNLGLAYLEKNKDYSKAEELFEKAISLKPNYSMAFNNLGNLYSEINEIPDAINSYMKAIKTDSTNAVALNNLAVIYLERSDINNAEKLLKQAIKINRNYFDGLNNYATVLIAKKYFSEAKKVLNNALSINHKSAKTYINFGLLYFENNNPVQAEEFILMALEKEPENEDAKEFLEFIRNPNQQSASINSVHESTQFYEKGLKLMESGNFTEAEKTFKEAIRTNPNYTEAYEKLAIALTNQKKYDEAITAFSDALDIKPDNPLLLKNMAVVYQKTGKMRQVVECYQKAARLGDVPAQEWLNLNEIKW